MDSTYEKVKSPALSLNTEDYKRIAQQVLVIYSPVFLLFLDQIQAWEFDYKILIALAISTTFDIIRRYIRELK